MFYLQIWLLIFSFWKFQMRYAFPIDGYVSVVGVYSTYRHIQVWTHFVCTKNGTEHLNDCKWPLYIPCISDENIKIALKLSSTYNNIQSRFITKFQNINKLFDSNENENENIRQGFVVDTGCRGFKSIFDQVSIPKHSFQMSIINISSKTFNDFIGIASNFI